MTGTTSYHAGYAAESTVLRHYESLGYALSARRWRGQSGEIDLIMQGDSGLVFVEVKHSKNRTQAALMLRKKQLERICLAVQEYLDPQPLAMMTPCRIDLALVDQHGCVEIIENISLEDI